MAEPALLRGLTLSSAFARWATEAPERIALVDGDRRLTFLELDELSDRLASSLVAGGIAKGDVVACQLPNVWEYVCLLLAATKVGAIISPQHIISRASEIEYCLGFADAKAFFYIPRYADFDFQAMVTGLRSRLPALRLVATVRGAPAAGESEFAALLAGAPGIELAARRPTPRDHFVLSFTSGTSGKPKGVLHAHDGPMSNAALTGELLQVGPDEVILCASSFSFAYGTYTIMVAFASGARQVLLDSFAPAPFFRLVERERVSFAFGVPAIGLALLNHPQAATTDFGSLRKFMISGATHPPTLIHRMRELMGCTPIILWGMTETYRGTVTRLDDSLETILSTVGGARPGWETAILDDQARILPTGQPGELAVRGPFLFQGYLRNPEAMADSFTPDGWFRTGDQAVIDERGYVRLTGRIKDLIRRGGVWISPKEIEDILYTHPKLRDCALVAMPDERLGERPCLFVVPQPGAELSLDEVRQFLDARGIAKYKWPERLELIAELPLNAARKVRKNLLREQIAARLADEAAGNPRE
jgi:acyl-CoA synthetase (AMP-forming)/AMP-acid ligase II